jgi:hypothetical protein
VHSGEGRAKLRVNVELQEDFSLDQALSLYLLDTLPLLDPQSPEHALDLLTLVESIVEDPDFILRKQLDKIKDRKMAEMKMNGVPFEERIEELEKLEYPKPHREFIYSTFNTFSDKHPWVGQENIRPKSIIREMFETFSSFGDYVRSYDLHRAEGLLLRHLNAVYRVLAQTVPDSAKTEAVSEIELFLGAMIKQTDSSILDEWEKMRDPLYQRIDEAPIRPPGAEEADRDITRDIKAFTALIRTRIFAFLRAVGKLDFEGALLSLCEDAEGEERSAATIEETAWSPDRLRVIFERYRVNHGGIRLDPEARNVRHTYVTPLENKAAWRVEQALVDENNDNDWMVQVEIDLHASRDVSVPVIKLMNIGPIEE